MPGVLGLFSAKPISSSTAAPIRRLLPGLCVEPNYLCKSCVSDDYANAAVFAPVWSPYVERRSIADVAVYGEAFVDAVPATAMLAQQLADCTPDTLSSILNQFDGSWCGFVWWSRLHRGALFVDHCGSKPIYYSVQNGELWFAPEPKALCRTGLTLTVDRTAIAVFLTVGHVLNDQTLYGEVRSLRPGTVLQFNAGRVYTSQYYDYSLADSGAPDEGESVYTERLHRAMTVAIERRRSRLGEAVIPISGGWDSRGILAYADLLGARLKTVSWGTNDNDPEADAAIGRQVATHFGAEHRFLRRRPESLPSTIEEMVSRVDALTTDPAVHCQEVEFMRLIRDEMDVRYLLRGDEVFGYMATADTEVQALGRIGIRRMTDYPDLMAIVRADVRQEFSSAVATLLNEISSRSPLHDYTARKDYHYFHQRLFNYLHKATYYKQTVLDISNPWLDKNILEVSSTVPLPYRNDKYLYKQTITRYFPTLRVPFALRASLEAWPDVMSRNRTVREFINDQLRQRNSPIYEFLLPERMASVMDALATGHSHQTGRVRLVESAKRALRSVSPALYGLVRKQTTGRVQIAAISPVDIVFRVLILKLWFDRHAPVALSITT